MPRHGSGLVGLAGGVLILLGLLMLVGAIPTLSITSLATVTGPSPVTNVVYIIMENKNCPITLSSIGAYANDNCHYSDIGSPSLPNYLALTAGSYPSCASSDADPSGCSYGSTINLVDRLEAAGVSWHGYMESMPQANICNGGGSSTSGSYYARHDPFVYYTDITGSASRCAKVVTDSSNTALLADLNSATASQFIWFTPNGCNDMHDSGCQSTGDTYLGSLVPKILASTTFTTKNALLIVGWDEYAPAPGPYFIGPAAKPSGYTPSATAYNDYSMLKTWETIFNLPTLTTNDAAASAMTEFLGSTISPPPPPPPPGPLPTSGNFNSTWATSATGSSSSTIDSVGILHETVVNTGTGYSTNYWATAQYNHENNDPTAAPINYGSFTATVANIATTTSGSSYEYRTYMGLYYRLAAPVTGSAGGATITSQFLDTQIIIQLCNSSGGCRAPSTYTSNLGTRFGYRIIIATTSPGQLYNLTYSTVTQYQNTLAAWGIPSSTQGALVRVEPGAEAYGVSSYSSNWYTVKLSGTFSSSPAPPPPPPAPIITGVSFTYSPASPTTGTTVTFQDKVTGGTAPFSYSWGFGDGSRGTGNPVTHAFATAATFTVTLGVTDTLGQTGSTSQTLTVSQTPPPSPLPMVSISYTPTVMPIIEPSAISFLATATCSSGCTVFSWTFTLGTLTIPVGGASAGISFTPGIAGNWTASVTTTDGLGRTASATASFTVVATQSCPYGGVPPSCNPPPTTPIPVNLAPWLFIVIGGVVSLAGMGTGFRRRH